MKSIFKLATILAVGSASFAVFAQSDMSAPGATPYGKFRPLEGQQAVAEQPAATPKKAPEAPQAQPAASPTPTPAPEQRAPTAAQDSPPDYRRPIAGAPFRHGRGANFAPGFPGVYPGDPRARYQARRRMMYDRNQYRRYATPRLRHGRYRRFGAPYGMPGPTPVAQPGQETAEPVEGQAPAAAMGRPGY